MTETIKYTLRMPDTLYFQVKERALRAGVSVQQYIIAACEEKLKRLASKEDLCQDEGCDHHGTPHVCVSGTTVENIRTLTPEGWQLVPKVPTVEQECATDFDDCPTPDAARATYQAMLAAAPPSPLDIVTVKVLSPPSSRGDQP